MADVDLHVRIRDAFGHDLAGYHAPPDLALRRAKWRASSWSNSSARSGREK
jgi:hypothetical protein